MEASGSNQSGSKKRPSKQLPTRRVAFPKQLDLLRGYAAAGAEGTGVTNEELGEIVGLASKTASLVNTFFVDVGFIYRTDRGSAPSSEVVNFQRAYQWDPEGAPKELAPVLRRAWFFDALQAKLRFGPLSEDQAIAVLGQQAVVGQEYAPELRLLLDYLEAAQIISRENGMVQILGDQRPAPNEVEPVKPTPRPEPTMPTGAAVRGSLPLLIQGLLEQLPKGEVGWSRAKANKWLELAAMTFEIVYDFEDGPELTPSKLAPDHAEGSNGEGL